MESSSSLYGSQNTLIQLQGKSLILCFFSFFFFFYQSLTLLNVGKNSKYWF